jgi:hypothetical protein
LATCPAIRVILATKATRAAAVPKQASQTRVIGCALRAAAAVADWTDPCRVDVAGAEGGLAPGAAVSCVGPTEEFAGAAIAPSGAETGDLGVTGASCGDCQVGGKACSGEKEEDVETCEAGHGAHRVVPETNGPEDGQRYQ